LIFDSILFDFDGVLADTEPIHYECWLEILEAGRLKPEPDPYLHAESVPPELRRVLFRP